MKEFQLPRIKISLSIIPQFRAIKKITPFRGNKNTPSQGNELRLQEGQYESHSDDDREWRNERVNERVNNYGNVRNECRKRNRKHETSDSELSSDSSNETETEIVSIIKTLRLTIDRLDEVFIKFGR